ncbi:MAG: ribosome recycling factor [Streptococcaceae bacterium]|jgi:ribosome recycling factor|nr:ribosome recycling factor [Streptococcaceae bacterium]
MVDIIPKIKDKMQKAMENLNREFGQIRVGRANASLLDRIYVDYYGVSTPLNQVAGIQVPEARLLLITPFDKTGLKDIEQALNASNLGLTPMNDGNVIRLEIPQLTRERRKELAKEVKKIAENSKITVRNIRKEAMNEAKKQEKNAELTEDDLYDLEKDIQKVTDDAVKKIDQITTEKEKELLDLLEK